MSCVVPGLGFCSHAIFLFFYFFHPFTPRGLFYSSLTSAQIQSHTDSGDKCGCTNMHFISFPFFICSLKGRTRCYFNFAWCLRFPQCTSHLQFHYNASAVIVADAKLVQAFFPNPLSFAPSYLLFLKSFSSYG